MQSALNPSKRPVDFHLEEKKDFVCSSNSMTKEKRKGALITSADDDVGRGKGIGHEGCLAPTIADRRAFRFGTCEKCGAAKRRR